tara:strand:- start:2243 stop:3826 length:1584 start_codon:yes stop_codon:yes gene_type:complete
MNTATLVKHIDPRLNLTANKQYTTCQGAYNISKSEYSPNGTIGSAINFSCNPPNRNIVVSRQVIKKVTFQVVITGDTVATNTDAFPAYSVSPAYMPVVRCTDNESMKIGNDTVTSQNSNIVREALCRYDCDSFYSGSANMNDTYQTFQDADGTIRSALAKYGDTYGETTSRRAFSNFATNTDLNVQTGGTAGDPVTATLTYTVEEPIFMSPFVFGKDADMAEGFYGIETMHYYCNFGNLRQAFNIDSTKLAATLTNLSVVVSIPQFALVFKYLTPQVNQPIPRNALFSYYEPYVRTNTAISVLAGTETNNVQSINLQLSGIPRRIVLLMRDTDTTGRKPLRYLSLVEDTMNIKINNQPSFLNQSNAQIYEMCKRNGLKLSRSQWENYVGSVIVVDVGQGDLALMPEQAPGVSQKNQFEFSARFRNNSTETINAEFTVITIFDGLFRMEDGNCRHEVNPLTEQAVLATPTNTDLEQDHSPDNVYGGGLRSGLRRVRGEIEQKTNMSGSGLQPVSGGRAVSRASLRNRY